MNDTLKFVNAMNTLMDLLKHFGIEHSTTSASAIDGSVPPDDKLLDNAVVVGNRAVIFDRFGFCSLPLDAEHYEELDQVSIGVAIDYLKG